MGKFADAVAAFSAKTKTNVNATISESALGMAIELVERSPVGDPALWASKPPKAYVPGTFKANWRGGFNAIDYTVTDDTDPTGEISVVNISEKIQEQFLSGSVFYITNSLPYAIALEDGHSKQAPAGIVALTVLDWQGIVSSAVLKVIR